MTNLLPPAFYDSHGAQSVEECLEMLEDQYAALCWEVFWSQLALYVALEHVDPYRYPEVTGQQAQ